MIERSTHICKQPFIANFKTLFNSYDPIIFKNKQFTFTINSELEAYNNLQEVVAQITRHKMHLSMNFEEAKETLSTLNNKNESPT